jgi:Uma2 family endonuclease
MNAPARLEKYTRDQFERMIDEGALSPSDRVELIEGYITDMNSKGLLHTWVQSKLAGLLFGHISRLQLAVDVQIEPMLRVGTDTMTQPDILVCNALERPRYPEAEDVLLLIEVADTSLGYDLSTKAKLYAATGIRDYWVIDVNGGTVYVMRDPERFGYRHMSQQPVAEAVTPALIEQMPLLLAQAFPNA